MDLNNPEIREFLFKKILINLGVQGNHTPTSIVDKMLDKAEDLTDKTILVLFNLEILEGLSRRGFLNKVTFIADSDLEEKFARAIYKVPTLLYADPKDWKENINNTTEDIMAQMNQAPDITFTNPPYTGSLDLKILLALKKRLKKLVCVHPATWLVDNKGTKNLFKEFRDTFDRHTSDLEVFNGNPVFTVSLYVPCVITTADMNATYKTKKVNWFGVDWKIDSFKTVTIHGQDWDPLVKDFQDKVSKYCSKHGNILENLISVSDVSKKYQVQLPAVRGHEDYDYNNMVKNDFYTLIQKNSSDNKGMRNMDAAGKTVLQIGSRKEQDSLLGYLQSDFARLCFSLLKTGQNVMRGETALIPWMDFTRSWTDDELFSELGYHKGHAIREYAKKFLPDYHNLYPNGKTY